MSEPDVTQTSQYPPMPPEQQQVMVVERRGNGMGVTGFVTGLLATIFGIIPLLFILSFPLGVVGIIFGFIGLRRANADPTVGGKGLSIAGLVLGIIGLILVILWVAAIGSAFDEVDNT